MAVRTEDLEYHRPTGSAPLLAGYYRPDGPGPFPAVLEVHGGAWTSGDLTAKAGPNKSGSFVP